MSNKKRDNFRKLETDIQKYWETEKLYESNVCLDKPKYFATFPIAYMNGRMHLGHLFTMTKADFMVRYQMMKGKNILFPFSFHCTGMPIQASAQKLVKEKDQKDRPQHKVMESMGILNEDIPKFYDPNHWLEYFPPLGVYDISCTGIAIDWRRSFITTEMNPYFNSFVEWLFKKLKSLGKISFGKRHTICSPTTLYPVMDHERAEGEGIMPKKYIMKFIELSDGSQLGVPVDIDEKNKDIEKIVISNKTLLLKCFNENTETANIFVDTVFDNYKHQTTHEYKHCEILSFDQFNKLATCCTTKIYIASIPTNMKISYGAEKNDQKVPEISYYEPDGSVVSRTGEKCIVALVDQWSIVYGADEKWKQETNKFVESDKFCAFPDKDLYKTSVNWLTEWACGRTFGLGTKIPWDKNAIIESLSDSTIYMAYYTVAHYLQGDLYGSSCGTANINPQELTDDIWDYIFLKGTYPSHTKINQNVLDEMRKEFEYWYPLDLRVSGKDLINNHLTMSLYTHQAIWPDGSKNPKCFATNGYITVDGKKMSKQSGNFVTVDDALHKWTCDSLRLTMAESGDTNDDANFSTKVVNKSILQLDSLLEWMTETCEKKYSSTKQEKSFDDDIFEHEMNEVIINVEKAHTNMRYRDIIKYGMSQMIFIRNKYLQKCDGMRDPNITMLRQFVETFCYVMGPIIPHFCEHVWLHLLKKKQSLFKSAFPDNVVLNDKIGQYKKYMENLLPENQRKITAIKPNKEDKTINIYYCSIEPVWSQTLKKLVAEERDMKKLIPTMEKMQFYKDADKDTKKFYVIKASYWIKEGYFEKFDDIVFLKKNQDYLIKLLKISNLIFVDISHDSGRCPANIIGKVSPGEAIITYSK